MVTQQELQRQIRSQHSTSSQSTIPAIHEQAEWIETQHKTFTNWCNLTLKKAGFTPMKDLVSGFHDGVNLCILVNELTGLNLKFNKNPKMRIQCIQNVKTALEAIEKDEKIRLVNITADAIVDGNLKLILGLIWSLIRHFQDVGRIEEKVKQQQSGSQAYSADTSVQNVSLPGQDSELLNAALKSNLKHLTGIPGIDENPWLDSGDSFDLPGWSNSSSDNNIIGDTGIGGSSSSSTSAAFSNAKGFGNETEYNYSLFEGVSKPPYGSSSNSMSGVYTSVKDFGNESDNSYSLFEGFSGPQYGSGGSVNIGASSGFSSACSSGMSSSKMTNPYGPLPNLSNDPVEKQRQFQQPFFVQPQYQRDSDLSQKQELVNWINYMTQIKIHNFTTDFSDGYILTRLVQRLQWDRKMRPIVKLNPNDSNEVRVNKALNWAKEIFGVPLLLDPDDVVHRPDELSMVTYLLCLRTTMIGYDKNLRSSTDHLLASKLHTKLNQRPAPKLPPKPEIPHFDSSEFEERRPSRAEEKRLYRPPTAQTIRDEQMARILQEQYNREAEREFEKKPGYPSTQQFTGERRETITVRTTQRSSLMNFPPPPASLASRRQQPKSDEEIAWELHKKLNFGM
jgi:hypothetical protein